MRSNSIIRFPPDYTLRDECGCMYVFVGMFYVLCWVAMYILYYMRIKWKLIFSWRNQNEKAKQRRRQNGIVGNIFFPGIVQKQVYKKSHSQCSSLTHNWKSHFLCIHNHTNTFIYACVAVLYIHGVAYATQSHFFYTASVLYIITMRFSGLYIPFHNFSIYILCVYFECI